MEIENPEDGQILRTLQPANSLQQLALHVVEGLADHRAVQHEEDGIHSTFQWHCSPLAELPPPQFDDLILNHATRRSSHVDGWDHLPVKTCRRLQKAPERGAITMPRQDLILAQDLELTEARHVIHERVRFVKQASKEDALHDVPS